MRFALGHAVAFSPRTAAGLCSSSSQAHVRRARVTVIQNGVLVQDNVAIMGPTGHHVRPQYTVP